MVLNGSKMLRVPQELAGPETSKLVLGTRGSARRRTKDVAQANPPGHTEDVLAAPRFSFDIGRESLAHVEVQLRDALGEQETLIGRGRRHSDRGHQRPADD